MKGLATTLDEYVRGLIRDEVRAAVAEALATNTKVTGRKLVSIATWAAARSLGISTARDAIKSGALPATRIGRAVRVAADAEIGTPVHVKQETTTAPKQRAARILELVGGAK